MALSGSYDWTLTRDEIISAALRKTNAIGTGEYVHANLLTECVVNLNSVIKALQADGMPVWYVDMLTVTPNAGTSQYAVGEDLIAGVGQVAAPAPLKVLGGWRREYTGSDYTDIELKQVSWQDYLRLPSKTTTGTPTHFCYQEPYPVDGTSAAYGLIYLWPTPSATWANGANQIIFNFQLPFDDMDSATDNLAFPSYWMQAVIWALADERAFEDGMPMADRAQLHKRAQEERAIALGFTTEEGSVTFVPSHDYLNSLKEI